MLGSSVLSVGMVPGLDASWPAMAPRVAQDPIRRERAAAELVRDATRMLGILAAGPAPASRLDQCLRGIPRAPVAARRAGVEAGPPVEKQDPIRRERVPGPLRNGNPRGNPNLAPRCGAKTRLGCPCKGPAMTNGRCRMHGGASTGPKTAAGKARIAAAQARRGDPARRTMLADMAAVVRRGRVLAALADAELPVAALVPVIRAIRGIDDPVVEPAVFVWSRLTVPPLTGGETRALVGVVRAMARQDPLRRERLGLSVSPRPRDRGT